MSEIDCRFRCDVQRDSHGDETALCRLLAGIAHLDEADARVPAAACAACAPWFDERAILDNPVFGSLVLSRALERQHAGVRHVEQKFLEELVEEMEERVTGQRGFRVPPTYACDVVVCVDDDSEQTKAAIRSVLEQDDVYPIVHLVDDHGQASLEEFERLPNVRLTRNREPVGLWNALHRVAPQCETPFMAIQAAKSVSLPNRLQRSLQALDDSGAEIFSAAVERLGIVDRPEPPNGKYLRCLPPESLVFRRAAFLDMGGVARDNPDDIELIYRAACEGRIFALDDQTLVQSSEVLALPNTEVPTYTGGPVFRSQARGYPAEHVECDVVLPFFGKLEFAEEALVSVLEQDEADTVIHLVDDASDEETGPFLKRWSSHSRVRVYRNRRNIGQFASFNNVSDFAETRHIAVQDGDDISLPGRIHRSVNLLTQANADLVGGTVELFGNAIDTVSAGTAETADGEAMVRKSMYPRGVRVTYYLENPTKVMRLEHFRSMGGYADYRDPIRNRTGLDTEYLVRAYYAQAAVAVTRDIVLRYRVHHDSATHNQTSGFGSTARTEAHAETQRRRRIYRQGRLDPRCFGGLKKYHGVTERLSSNS